MKKLVFVISVVVFALVVALGGNRIAGRILDAQLAPLLTDVLGLPVTLGPIKANLLQLKARTPRLVMGPEEDPAVVAENVTVTLSLEALLEGEIRLDFASARELTVTQSKWPRTEGPLPENYHFLDPWLPPTLAVTDFHLGSESGKGYPMSNLRWFRHPDGSFQVLWREERQNGELAVDTTVQSLHDLLGLAPVAMHTRIDLPGDDTRQVKLDVRIAPGGPQGEQAAYTIEADIDGPGVSGGRLKASSAEAWSLPDTSDIHVDLLQIEDAAGLVPAFAREAPEPSDHDRLAAPVPIIEYFEHAGTVSIGQMRWGDEMGTDTAFDFTTGAGGVTVSNLRSRGPSGKLTGEIHLLQENASWAIGMEAKMVATEGPGGIGDQFMHSDWLWESGMAQIRGRGDTWAELINSLAGQLNLAGHHRDEEKTPVTIAAQLDKLPGAFGLDDISFTLGDGIFKGSATMASNLPRVFTLTMTGEKLDLDFLFDDETEDIEDGIALPEFLGAFPGIDIDARVKVNDLRAPGLNLAQASVQLQRNQRGGTFKTSAKGVKGGDLDIDLDWDLEPGAMADVQMKTNFTGLDLLALFNQQGILGNRATGTMSFTSKGEGVKNIFQQMRGTADVSLRMRPDDNWARDSREGEELDFASEAQLVLKGDRITGVRLSDLQIRSLHQDVTGEVSFVDGRTPWLIADLRSRQLDITDLMELLPESREEADRQDFLQSLRDLGALRMSLEADKFFIEDTQLTNARLQLDSAANLFDIRHLDFSTHGSDFKSRGTFTWKGDLAQLEAEATLENVNLDQFLIDNPNRREIPVSGTAKITSSGSSVSELIGNATGHIELDASDELARQAKENRRHFSLVATRLPDGVEANIESLQWGESELAGQLRYYQGSPPRLEARIKAGTLSLLPWETTGAEPGKSKGDDDPGRKSRNAVTRALLAPLRLLDTNRETPPGERIFSSEPIDFQALNRLDATFSGSLDALVSSVIQAQHVSFDGALVNGVLKLDVQSTQLAGGEGEAHLQLDTTTPPAKVEFKSTFKEVRRLANAEGHPRSGFIAINSSGGSVAELAAGTNGLLFLELGAGPFDYINATLMTADLASTVFQTLIPGIESEPQRVECGITVGILQDGVLVTPYGFSVRTNHANLLGRMEIDLGKETLQMTFDSRSRKGVGLSVGNVFSSTVRVIGPLSNPRIAPRATSLAWRGWAAMMTAGLSVVGESVLKRVLASENPCKSTRRIIERELCPKSELAAASPMICPASATPPSADDPYIP